MRTATVAPALVLASTLLLAAGVLTAIAVAIRLAGGAFSRRLAGAGRRLAETAEQVLDLLLRGVLGEAAGVQLATGLLLGSGDGEGARHLGACRVVDVVVEDEPDPGQVLGRVEPGEGDGALEVERLVGEAALDVPGEAGVPAQRQGTEQGELVAEGVGDAVDVEREQPVEALVGGADDRAEDVVRLAAAVENAVDRLQCSGARAHVPSASPSNSRIASR